VTLAADVAQALALAAAQRFDAAVLDIQLPGGDGRGLATQLQGIEPGRPLPVVFVTAFVGAEDADGARTPGVLGCLPKPFDPERLVGLLRRAAAGPAGPAAAASGPAASPAAPAAVAALYRREWPQLARAVRQARSRERLAQAVHALRGALAWMGDRAALALAAEVESGLHAGRERRGLPLRALLKRARALAGD
jgi:CheY-like chemotaxis protein